MVEILRGRGEFFDQDIVVNSDVSGVREIPKDVPTIDDILRARKVGDKDFVKNLVSRYLAATDEKRPANQIRYVGWIAYKETGDQSFVQDAIAHLEKRGAWREVGRLYNLIDQHQKAIDALEKHFHASIKSGDFEETYDSIKVKWVTHEERVRLLKKLFEAEIASDDYDTVLAAAFQAQRNEKYGFSKEDVKRAATKAYNMALKQPHAVINMDKPGKLFEDYQKDDGRPDAELIKEQFGLAE